MKRLIAAAAFALVGTAAMAEDVFGTWRSPTNPQGAYLVLDIVQCGTEICGNIIEAGGPADPAIVGRQMISGMKVAGGGKYSGGKVWAPDEDRNYNGRLTLNGDTLQVAGCVFGICRGEYFTRN